MANYGYSAGYQGGGASVLPPGYLESYANAGRSIGQGIANVGSAIGDTLAQYGKNRAESDFLNQRLENLAPLLQHTLGTAGDNPNSPESKLAATLGKYSGMSNSQKKAALLDAEFFLKRKDDELGQKHQQLQNDLAAQQLDALKRAKEQQDIQTQGIRYGLGMPSVGETVTQTSRLQYPEPVNVPASTIPAGVTETALARGFLSRAATASDQLAAAAAAQMDAAKGTNVSPLPGSRFVPAVSPMSGTYAPQGRFVPTETPLEAQIRAETNRRAQAPQLADAAQLQAQADLLKKASQQTLSGGSVVPAQTIETQGPPQEIIDRKVSTTPIPYEESRKQMQQFLVSKGADANTLAAVDSLLNAAGKVAPMRVTETPLSGGGSVITAGGKVEINKQTPEEVRNITERTIRFPEFQGLAPTPKEAEDFRALYGDLLSTKQGIGRLLEIAQLGKIERQSPTIRGEAQSIATKLKGSLRKEIIGPGAVSDAERAVMDKVVADPTAIWSLDANTLSSLRTLEGAFQRGVENKAKSLGIIPVNSPAAQSKTLTYDPVTKTFH